MEEKKRKKRGEKSSWKLQRASSIVCTVGPRNGSTGPSVTLQWAGVSGSGDPEVTLPPRDTRK